MLVWQDTHAHENMGFGLQEVLNKCQVPHQSLPSDKLSYCIIHEGYGW